MFGMTYAMGTDLAGANVSPPKLGVKIHGIRNFVAMFARSGIPQEV